jgi:SAM-dependent methyltransferase
MTSVPAPLSLGSHLCPACLQPVEAFDAGGSTDRQRSRCPWCGSLERHRFLAVLLDLIAPTLDPSSTIVEVAPTETVSRLLARFRARRYLRLDLDPSADGRAVDVQASLTHLPLEDASVDLLVCYHVLEHVLDDARAMREIARVLTLDGLALVQVPYRFGEPTEEDPEASAEERTRRFGQADHVRWYGDDFEVRLARAGLSGQRVRPLDLLGRSAAEYLWTRNAPVWLLRTGDHAAAAIDVSQPQQQQVLPLLVERILTHEGRIRDLEAQLGSSTEELRRLRDERDRVRDQRDTWRDRHERLTSHPVARAVSRLRRALVRRDR